MPRRLEQDINKMLILRRAAIAFRSLMGSQNDDLTVAFSEFQRMVKREQDVVTKAILAGVTRLQSDTHIVNLNVSKGIALSQDIQRDTRDLTIRTANIDRSIQSMNRLRFVAYILADLYCRT